MNATRGTDRTTGWSLAFCAGCVLSAVACGNMGQYGFTGIQGPSGLFGVTEHPEGNPAGGALANVPPADAQPMSGAAFDALKAEIEKESFSSKQVATVERAAGSNYFTAAQVGELTTFMKSPGDRKRIIELCADRILDLDDTSALTQKLTFAGERDEAEVLLRNALAKRSEAQAQHAEEQRKAEEQRSAEASAGNQTGNSGSGNSGSSTSSSSSSSSSASCCLGERFNACDDGAAAAACGSWGMCLFRCMSSGQSRCEATCTERHPDVQRCRHDPSKDHTCKK